MSNAGATLQGRTSNDTRVAVIVEIDSKVRPAKDTSALQNSFESDSAIYRDSIVSSTAH